MEHARGRDVSNLKGTTRLLKSPTRIAHGELAVCYGGRGADRADMRGPHVSEEAERALVRQTPGPRLEVSRARGEETWVAR